MLSCDNSWLRAFGCQSGFETPPLTQISKGSSKVNDASYCDAI